MAELCFFLLALLVSEYNQSSFRIQISVVPVSLF